MNYAEGGKRYGQYFAEQNFDTLVDRHAFHRSHGRRAYFLVLMDPFLEA